VAAIAAVLCIPTVAPGMILTGFFIGVIANFAFEGGIVFYNAYLPEIAPKSHHGRISAKGYATGYVGSLVALVYAAVFAEFEMIDLIWVALALQWVFAALPAFKTLPADRPTGTGFFAAARDGFRTTRQTIRDVWGMRDLRWFFIAYFFYMDGVITVINFSSRYATKTLGFTLTEAMGLLALVQISALAGSLIMAGPTDRKGPKWTVRLILLWWIGVVIAAYFAQTKLVFTGVAVLAGLGLGSIQAASRAFMSRLIPPGREGEMFGFYGLCGKSGAILGPMLFGVISFNLGQRPAILSVAAFYIVGYLLLEKVRTDGTVSP
jgi:UMF1 family MFS transporter